MKFIPHAAAISMIATSAAAGGLSDAIVESEPMEEPVMAAPAGSSDWIIPVVIFGALAAVALSSNGDDDDDPEPVSEPPVEVVIDESAS